MWMAMLCSVTVSMGDETNGVLRVMRLVMGESRATVEAGKPFAVLVVGKEQYASLSRTNVPRKDEEVIVCETSILLGVDQLLRTQSVSLLIVAGEDLEGILVVEDFNALCDSGHGSVLVIAVELRHFDMIEMEGRC